MKNTIQTVHVCAYHSTGGAGFDWYYTAEQADEAFKLECANADEFKDEEWEAFRYDYTLAAPVELTEEGRQAITDEIDGQIDELSAESPKRYKAAD